MSKILIIDDEEKLRNLLARLIKLEGYTVTEVGSQMHHFSSPVYHQEYSRKR